MEPAVLAYNKAVSDEFNSDTASLVLKTVSTLTSVEVGMADGISFFPFYLPSNL